MANTLASFSEKEKPETQVEMRGTFCSLVLYLEHLCRDLQRKCKSPHCMLILIFDWEKLLVGAGVWSSFCKISVKLSSSRRYSAFICREGIGTLKSYFCFEGDPKPEGLLSCSVRVHIRIYCSFDSFLFSLESYCRKLLDTKYAVNSWVMYQKLENVSVSNWKTSL